MINIPTSRLINLEWTVKKGIGNEAEDFSRSTVSLFVFNEYDRWPIACNADAHGKVTAEIPATLAEGVYHLELVWVKNGSTLNELRCIQRTRKDCVFMIDGQQALPIAINPDSSFPGAVTPPSQSSTIKMETLAAPYGYDGLSAYEICVMRGKTTKSEDEWAEALSV